MSGWIEYNIRAGERNFSPMEPFWPGLARQFEFWVAFHHSCYYSKEDWTLDYDMDWHDVNKLAMLTLAYTPNNHLSYGAGFMPGNISREILVTPYTNYPGSNFVTRRTDSLPVQTAGSLEEAQAAEKVLYGRVTRNSRAVHYTFERGEARLETSHPFRTPWYMPWVSRRAGTWMGGKNNAPGPYGGKASQDMKLWLEFNTI